jgi:adenine-specific DNA-methyltransferase
MESETAKRNTDSPDVQLEPVKTYPPGTNCAGWLNMLVQGDNLAVLKALMQDEKVCGRVGLVYIDPPFATNQHFRRGPDRTATISPSATDEIAYSDRLSGAEYLEFMRKRLILLKDIMAPYASIYVHIDYKVGHYVKVLMDEVFGRENFINDITRIKCNPKNFVRKGFGNIKDLILFYAMGKDYTFNGATEDFSEADIVRLFAKVDEATGARYTTTPLHAPGETRDGPTGRPWKGLAPPKGRHWRYPPDELTRLDEQGLIEWSSTGNPRKKIYADACARKGKKRQDIWWDFKDPCYPDYPTEKNLDMLRMIIKASSNPDDIVLDCFAGSGGTALAAAQCGRRWIAIDNSPAAIGTIKKRLHESADGAPFILYGANP